jgi:hypothetical protein
MKIREFAEVKNDFSRDLVHPDFFYCVKYYVKLEIKGKKLISAGRIPHL